MLDLTRRYQKLAQKKDLSDLAPISIRVAKGTKIWKKGRKK